jgi:alginate O-acetyltransferase complex protein AlgI
VPDVTTPTSADTIMVFSAMEFLFYFLPITVIGYLLISRRLKNAFLLAASLLFYVWGGGAFVFVLALSIVSNYGFGILVARGRHLDKATLVRIGVIASVVVNVGILGYFKYANFFVAQINTIAVKTGTPLFAWADIALPIGISFYTFQSMSYVFDVARGKANYLRNPFDFALYVALFPQLIAGPIVRFHEIAGELRERTTRVDDIAEGALRFFQGLTKKVIIADAAATLAEAAFSTSAGDLTTGVAWVGIVAYTVQIYFDFSGYSDMAIGLGRVFGFHFPENFRRPYSATSITDFWRRWHITLSNWFRDYVYIPLGGSQKGNARTYVNLSIVFFLTGLWHGANWTFIVWGMYHGALLIIERASGLRATESSVNFAAIRRAITLLLVMVGWVIFRSPDLGYAVDYLTVMFTPHGHSLDAISIALTNRVVLLTCIGAGVALLPPGIPSPPLLDKQGTWPALARAAMLLLLVPYAAMLVASGSFSPFLYFQF